MIEVAERSITFFPPHGATHLIGDFTDWDEKPLPISRSLQLEFPPGAYVEYAFLDAEGRPIADHANPERPKHPWYEYHRACTLPGSKFVVPPQVEKIRGTVRHHEITSSKSTTHHRYVVYEPFCSPQANLLILDGGGFFEKLHFHQVAESLLLQDHIHPVRMIFLEPENRLNEYWLNESFESFILTELLPQIRKDYSRTVENAIWGASLGGLTAAWIAWRNPHVFRKVTSQSGAFKTAPSEGREDASYYRDHEYLADLIARESRRDVRFYLDTGMLEWLLAPNRRFAAILADKGYSHAYQEWAGGHNWTTWEQGLEPGLVYLFGNTKKSSPQSRLELDSVSRRPELNPVRPPTLRKGSLG